MKEWISLNEHKPDLSQIYDLKTTSKGYEYIWQGYIWDSPYPADEKYLNFPAPTHYRSLI